MIIWFIPQVRSRGRLGLERLCRNIQYRPYRIVYTCFDLFWALMNYSEEVSRVDLENWTRTSTFKKNIIGHSVPVFGNLELLATQHVNDFKDSTATDRQRIRLLKIFNCTTTSRTLQAKLKAHIWVRPLYSNHWSAIIGMQSLHFNGPKLSSFLYTLYSV